MGGVLRGEDGRDAGVGPVDAEGGVVEAEAALGFLAVEVVALVGEEGVKNWRRLSAERRTATCLPKVGEPLRMSTATSQTAPRRTRTSLAWAWGPACQWRPRTTPRAERLSLS